jgi:phospholipase/lecithinase/hemolysin
MAQQERVAVAEIHGAFLQQSNRPSLFYDEKHPSDEGYHLIAQAFFSAITRPYSASAPSSARAGSLFRRLF